MAELVASTKSLRLFHKLRSKEARSGQGPSIACTGKQVVVVRNTLLYRHLASASVSADDRVVEIGCSYGHCTTLFRCTALAVDIAPEKVEIASEKFPHCNFVCEDIFGDDLSWLDRQATVLFLDIGGSRLYKPAMKALSICISLMPALRLAVLKSTEVSRFLLHFQDSIKTVAHDLAASKDDDAQLAEEIAVEIRRRGGELPMSLICTHLHCSQRLRYLAGKQRIHALLKAAAPTLQLVEVDFGPLDLRTRVRATPGEAGAVALAPSQGQSSMLECDELLPQLQRLRHGTPVTPPSVAALAVVRRELAEKVSAYLRRGQEHFFLGVFAWLKVRLLRKYLALAADPELHRQASDHALDPRCNEAWSEAWRTAVILRHLHAFLRSRPEFAVVGDMAGPVPTHDELCGFLVEPTGAAPEEVDVVADVALAAVDDARLELQVLDANWCTGEGDVPEVKDLIVDRAWVLEGGQVIEDLIGGPVARGRRTPGGRVIEDTLGGSVE